MPASTQQHPCLLVLNGHAAARAELRAAVAENRPAKIGNVNLAGKECKQVCFVRFEQRGEELWLVEIVTRPRGKPKSGPSKTPPKSHPLKPKDGYRVIW